MFANMRNLLSLLILLNAPVSLAVMAWGLALIYKAAGLAMFMFCCASMFIAALGIASLLDSLDSNRSSRSGGR